MRLAAAPLILFLACAENPADSTPSAAVAPPSKEAPKDMVTITPPPDGEAPAAAPTAPTPAPAADSAEKTPSPKTPLTGHIHFTGSKVTGSHTCRFDTWTGDFTPGADGKITSAALSFTVETASLYCDWDARNKWTEKFEKHMKDADFLEVESHPQATFVSQQIQETSAGPKVTGVLTILGIAHSITFPAEISSSKDGFAARARFDIDRKKWGIEYPGKPDNLIRDEVVLDIDLKTK